MQVPVPRFTRYGTFQACSGTLTRLCGFAVPMFKASDVLVNVIHQEFPVCQYDNLLKAMQT